MNDDKSRELLQLLEKYKILLIYIKYNNKYIICDCNIYGWKPFLLEDNYINSILYNKIEEQIKKLNTKRRTDLDFVRYHIIHDGIWGYN